MSKLVHISNILDDFFKEDKITKLQELQENMEIEFVSDNKRYLSFSFDKQLPNKDFPKGLFPFFKVGKYFWMVFTAPITLISKSFLI